MDFTKLRSFNKAYPLFVEKYELFSLGENASITDKINSVVQALNKVGKLSNDVLKDWNKVMEWAMGEGLDESVNKSIMNMETQSISTTFNVDGSITETFEKGLVKTTTFNSDGSITEVYSSPINKTKTITFNSDGSISEVVV